MWLPETGFGRETASSNRHRSLTDQHPGSGHENPSSRRLEPQRGLNGAGGVAAWMLALGRPPPVATLAFPPCRQSPLLLRQSKEQLTSSALRGRWEPPRLPSAQLPPAPSPHPAALSCPALGEAEGWRPALCTFTPACGETGAAEQGRADPSPHLGRWGASLTSSLEAAKERSPRLQCGGLLRASGAIIGQRLSVPEQRLSPVTCDGQLRAGPARSRVSRQHPPSAGLCFLMPGRLLWPWERGH